MNKNYIYPAAIVFDLDYTLWPCWCDTHISMPLKVVSTSRLIDSSGMEVSFYKDVESILTELKSNKVTIIAASRTATPHVAKEILSKLHIHNTPAIKYFDSLQWGHGTKTKHISRAAKELRLEKELSEGQFILFDDEIRNRDVQSLNCRFAFLPDESKGLTRSIFENHLIKYTNDMKNILKTER